jgi:hypothetical protein
MFNEFIRLLCEPLAETYTELILFLLICFGLEVNGYFVKLFCL